jgi:hypothetical protein
MGLFIVTYDEMKKSRYLVLSAIAIEVLLSGSRSAAVGFVVVLIFVSLKSRQSLLKSTFWITATAIGVLIPVYVLQLRGTNIDTLDRINFLNHFLGEVRGWDLLTWAFGTPPITQLNYSTCQSLSFYSTLLSSSGDGTCYSVILHSFILRAIFDTGVCGLIACFYILNWVMKHAGVECILTLALLGLALANSISVSGPNNIYVIFPMIVATLKSSELNQYAPEARSNPGKVSSLRPDSSL